MDMNRHATRIAAVQASFAELGYVELDNDRSLEHDRKELCSLLHNAMVLEHATIPPYLTMLYTLDDDVEWRVVATIRSVVIEEMLHFTLVANLLNAIGGTPAVDQPDFMRGYPATLPYGVDGIAVHLFGFSREGVQQGLQIEHPKQIRPARVLREDPGQMTIGEFYAYIEARLRAAVGRHGESAIFCGDGARQIEPRHFYYGGGGDMVAVRGFDSAHRAIRMIADQGEGSRHGIWVRGQHEAAHYFKFSELYNGRLYREGDTVAGGPTGDPLPIDWSRGVPVRGDARLRDYPEGEAREAIVRFNRRYQTLLAGLQGALSGRPDELIPAVVAMCALRDDFRAITANPFPGDGRLHCVPTFEYDAAAGSPAGHAEQLNNAATLARLERAFATNDLPLALGCMSEDVVWDISGPSECPYFGVYYGHAGFARFWRVLADAVHLNSAGTRKFFVLGDEAMAYGGEEGSTRSGNVPYRYDWAHRYRFDAQHRITLIRQYFNPLNILSALKAAPYPAPPAAPAAPAPSAPPTVQPNGDAAMTTPLPCQPNVPAPFTLPFYYASLSNVGVYFLVPESKVLPYLADSELRPALFDGQAMVSFNFQLYTGQFASGVDAPVEQWAASGVGVTQELELNIVAYPASRADQVAPLGARQFIQDGDQTKLYGNHRVWVPCDAQIAIAAGEQLFGEPKFLTTFKVNLASDNPTRTGSDSFVPQWVDTWGFRVNDPADSASAIFTCIVRTAALVPVPGNISPITEYGRFEDKLIGCRWNILQPMNTYFLDNQQAQAVQLTLGNSTHPMRRDLEALIGGAVPVAVQTLNSAPVAIQSRSYYP